MVAHIYQKYLVNRLIAIDSRKVVPGALFFALRGPRFNGNAFAAEALAKGASAVVIDDPAYAIDAPACMVVKDSLVALAQLAGYHRRQYVIPIIAITGSYGKTTTKELITRVLRTTYRTVATEGNLNTHIGVALTLLAIDSYTEIAVIEMGATQVGDIARCCKIAQPTHGLITSIGAVHLDGFASIEGVRQGKGELYDYLYAQGGKIFLNTLDPLLCKGSLSFAAPITYPQAMDFAPLDWVDQVPYLRYRFGEGQVVTTHLLGKSNFYNIAAALCVGKYFKVPLAVMHSAIEAYIPTNKRMEVVVKGSNQCIVDSYNASPASVEMALEALLQLKVPYRVVVLGDMAELGDQMASWHATILERLQDPNYDLVLLCGPYFAAAAKRPCSDKIHLFPDKTSLAVYLRKQPLQYSGILLKGAHSLAMDTLLEAIA